MPEEVSICEVNFAKHAFIAAVNALVCMGDLIDHLEISGVPESENLTDKARVARFQVEEVRDAIADSPAYERHFQLWREEIRKPYVRPAVKSSVLFAIQEYAIICTLILLCAVVLITIISLTGQLF